MKEKTRCPWSEGVPPKYEELFLAYHDHEWGIPVHDDRKLFELLLLEGAQAGLSWSTILEKRENYRKAYDHFDPEQIAQYGAEKKQALLQNSGIIRNRLKVEASVTNAKAFLEVQKEVGTFDSYIWSFVGGAPLLNRWEAQSEIPAKTAISDAMSKDLKKRGFKFIGSTICYAYMQAIGMVNDHTLDCFLTPFAHQLQ